MIVFATAVFKAIKLSQLGGEQQQQHVRCVRDFNSVFAFSLLKMITTAQCLREPLQNTLWTDHKLE